ncbi:hypothetical protein GCM10010172_22090 [Paractinoplanes ferrugineus]|uniref:non-specific serine/threonine protein kinase n=1 Tax=Paractinoplanes ferrugineus TaxID=113564 RepID=A0A919MDU8_9ACTN|nr:serine/threonine-protein kinase [Actinoplanes ferrugineus]GIE08880.1 hypothetical protein Afe05nite_07200 [Actinoplanes ferrugineus]
MEVQQTLGGRYKLLDELGSGGMAVVWRARDEVLGRPVAVKLLAGRYAGDPQSRARIRDEARSAATLSHPNIAQVYDYGEAADTGTPYVVMELINGPTLQQRVATGKLPPRSVFRICGEVAAALAAAHADGLVHRDIKMANIMVTPAGAKVVDFGIAAAAGPAAPEEMLVGTPAYLAPERLTGDAIVPASDVYALGVLLYRLLAGGSPWSVESTTQMLRAHVYVEPAPLPETPGVPPAVIALIARCLAKDPASRPSATEVSAILGDAAEASLAIDPGRVRVDASPPPSPASVAAGEPDDFAAETGVWEPARPPGSTPGGSAVGVDAGPEAERAAGLNAGPGSGPGAVLSAGPRADRGAGPGERAGGGHDREHAADARPAGLTGRGARNRPAAAETEVLRAQSKARSGGWVRGVPKKQFVLVGVIVALVVAALVGLGLQRSTGARSAEPEAAAGPTVAPSVSRQAGVPTVSRSSAVIRPSATAGSASPQVRGREPSTSVSPVRPAPSRSAPGTAKPTPSATPPPEPEGKLLESPGGIVFAVCGTGRAEFTWWEAKPGYSVEDVDPGPSLAPAAIFRSMFTRYRTTVTCVAGSPTAVVLPL